MKTNPLVLTSALLVLLFAGCAGKTKPSPMNESLHIPAGKGKLEKVKAEIESGTNVNLADAAGQTALMYAAENGSLDVVKFLVEKGANVNAKSNRLGRGTALIYASANNRIGVMDYLLEHGSDIDATSHSHETALMWATAFGRMEAVNLLIDKKANTRIKNKHGKTALDIAKDLNRKNIEVALAEATNRNALEEIEKAFKLARKKGKQQLLIFVRKHPDSEFSNEGKRLIARIDQIENSMNSKTIDKQLKIGMPISRVKKSLGDPQSTGIKISNVDSSGRVGISTVVGSEGTWLYCDNLPKDLPYCGTIKVSADLKGIVTKVSSGAVFRTQ